MAIDYYELSERYKPENFGLKTETLLVAEAPPPNGTSYFYLPKKLPQYKDISNARTLSHTIFYHYFKSIPSDLEECKKFLTRLMKRKIFLMDIYELPVCISKCGIGINEPNRKKYIFDNIPKLRDKIKNRGLLIEDKNIIFLDPNHGSSKELKKEFPDSKISKWIEFRMG